MFDQLSERLQSTLSEVRSRGKLSESDVDAAMSLVAKTTTIVATWDRLRRGLEPIAPHPTLRTAANFLYMCSGEEPYAARAKALDPYYVLPIMMMATQFWQQLTMPSAGADPAQQKMMLFMPLVMGFIFLFLPAGALLYYVVTNVVGIGQQYATNYMIGPPKIRTARAAAERRLKRVGSSKTDAAAREE